MSSVASRPGEVQTVLFQPTDDILSVTGDGDQHCSAPHGLYFNHHATDSSLDSIAAMKKSKNREAAKRSRQKKKSE